MVDATPPSRKKVGDIWLVRIGDGPILKVIIDGIFTKTVELRLAGSYRDGAFHKYGDVEFIEKLS